MPALGIVCSLTVSIMMTACGGDVVTTPDASQDATIEMTEATDADAMNDSGVVTDAGFDADCGIPADAQCNAKLTGCSNTPSFSPPNDWACLCGMSCTVYCQTKNGFALPQCVYTPDASFFQCECHQA